MDIHQLNQLKADTNKSKQRDAWVALFGLLVMISIAVFSVLTRTTTAITAALFVAVFLITVIIIFINHKKRTTAQKTYISAYKSYFAHKTLSGKLHEFQYDHSHGISKDIIKNLNVLKLGNYYRAEDLIIGKYKDTSFTQSDLTIKDITGNENDVIYFSGRWIIVDYPKKFTSNLIIVGKTLAGSTKIPPNYEKFETESTDFNKRLDVYTTNGYEMFYLLDPKTIERIQALAEKYALYSIFIFDNRKLHIGLAASDSLEPPMTKTPIDEAKELERHTAEFRPVFDLVDSLELNKKLFAE